MRIARFLVPIAMLAAALTALLAPTAFSYIGQNPYDVNLGAPVSIDCSKQATITAKVRLATTGDPVAGQLVYWDLKQSAAGDSLKPTSSITDSNGVTSTTLTFAPYSAMRVVRATIAQYPATISINCTGAPPAPTPLVTAPPTPTQAPPTAPPSQSTTPQPTASGVPYPTTEASPSASVLLSTAPPTASLATPSYAAIVSNAPTGSTGPASSSSVVPPVPPSSPPGQTDAAPASDMTPLAAAALVVVLVVAGGGLVYALRRRRT